MMECGGIEARMGRVEVGFHPDVPLMPVARTLSEVRHPANYRWRLWRVVGGIRSSTWALLSIFLVARS